MPQKFLKPKKKIEKKKEAPNRHGKEVKTKKGAFDKPPKKSKALQAFVEEKELTKFINAKNEQAAAGKAEQAGGQLKLVKAPPPVLAPKDQQKQMKKAKAGKTDEDDDF